MMRAAHVATALLIVLPAACGSSSSSRAEEIPFTEANELMAEEIDRRISQIPFQHREELFNNLLWLAQAGEQALPSLMEGLEHNDAKVRSNCAWVVGQIGDRRTIPTLRKITTDDDQTVRLEAARSLVAMGDMRFATQLIEGLDSDKVQVRYLCHEALKSASGRDFGFDHLTDDIPARTVAAFRWRQWWGESSGDTFFAEQYAAERGLTPEGQWAAPGAAPDGETEKKEEGGDRPLEHQGGATTEAKPEAKPETTGGGKGSGSGN